MNILFTTDLHGNERYYERLYEGARMADVDVVINGGDMLPKEGDLFAQDKFITGFLAGHFRDMNAIYVIHMPPAGVGLDMCRDGRSVGSSAIRAFIEREQPLFSLHGHIHESPQVSGKWRGNIGRTVCIQPGQNPTFTCVVIDMDTGGVKRLTADCYP